MFDATGMNIHVIEDLQLFWRELRSSSLYKAWVNLHEELKLWMIGGGRVVFIGF